MTRTIEQAIVRKLREVLADWIGCRVYRDTYPMPENGESPTFPLVVYQHLSDDDQIFLSGGRDSTRRDNYQLEIWSSDASDCDAIRESLKSYFSGANCRGRWGGDGGLFICGAVVSDASGDVEFPMQGDEELDRAERLTMSVIWDTEI